MKEVLQHKMLFLLFLLIIRSKLDYHKTILKLLVLKSKNIFLPWCIQWTLFIISYIIKKNLNKINLNSFLSTIPSFANPKSVNLSIASSSLFVKSKFSGLRSPIEIT